MTTDQNVSASTWTDLFASIVLPEWVRPWHLLAVPVILICILIGLPIIKELVEFVAATASAAREGAVVAASTSAAMRGLVHDFWRGVDLLDLHCHTSRQRAMAADLQSLLTWRAGSDPVSLCNLDIEGEHARLLDVSWMGWKAPRSSSATSNFTMTGMFTFNSHTHLFSSGYFGMVLECTTCRYRPEWANMIWTLAQAPFPYSVVLQEAMTALQLSKSLAPAWEPWVQIEAPTSMEALRLWFRRVLRFMFTALAGDGEW